MPRRYLLDTYDMLVCWLHELDARGEPIPPGFGTDVHELLTLFERAATGRPVEPAEVQHALDRQGDVIAWRCAYLGEDKYAERRARLIGALERLAASLAAPPTLGEWIGVAEVRARAGVSRRTAYRLEIPYVEVGRQRRYLAADVDDYLAAHQRHPANLRSAR
jgi:hypothetical protein